MLQNNKGGLISEITKGQLISKCLFGIFYSSQKQTKKFNFTTMVPQGELFSFILWENWRHQKDISKLTDLYILKFSTFIK
jgi:hypothetical protein